MYLNSKNINDCFLKKIVLFVRKKKKTVENTKYKANNCVCRFVVTLLIGFFSFGSAARSPDKTYYFL